jgi:hypothetical protein
MQLYSALSNFKNVKWNVTVGRFVRYPKIQSQENEKTGLSHQLEREEIKHNFSLRLSAGIDTSFGQSHCGTTKYCNIVKFGTGWSDQKFFAE